MFRRQLADLQQRGDTIVEVLIAITLASMMLGGAYVTSNHSLKSSRDSQEHSEALQLVQAQIEEIRALEVNGSSLIYTAASPFCITHATAVTPATPASGCTLDSSGQAGAAGSRYYVQINRSGANNDTFTVGATWPSIDSDTTADSTQLIYKLPEPVATVMLGGGPQTPDIDGVSHGDGTCTDACAGDPPPNGTYHWDPLLTNITPSTEATKISGCEWDFGPGAQPLDDQYCAPGSSFHHTFPVPAHFPPYPQGCLSVQEVVTLHIYLTDGNTATNSDHFKEPNCF